MRALAKITGMFARLRFAQKIWPDFGFHDDDEGGANGAQRAAHWDDPVERKIKDAVGGLQTLAGEALAGFRGGGDEKCDGRENDV